MADKAQAEPTMEEILASIRKIIADDSDTGGATATRAAPEPKVAVSVGEPDEFDDLSLDDVLEDSDSTAEALASDPDDEFESLSDDDDLLTDVDEDMFDNLTAESIEEEAVETAAPVDPDLEDFDFDAVDLDVSEPVIEDTLSAPETDLEEEFVSVTEEEDEPAAEPAPVSHSEETHMLRGKTEAPAAQSGGITDERIAGAAASALGKLMVKQSTESGDPNTLEGLMMEMLRPMLKEWLDANLPAIVERKVEEEVRRIARMAG
ncbi:DUF2497 domain-containing protein [Henriciella sp. AS95]|uniref:DUF2497 domain-containing protein n=1 Tax=Henriciella sp. AS95 TaxID=3135782 RepID=UPI003177B95D